MAQMLDLNALEQPIQELRLRDENKTLFRLVYPSEKLVERFMAASKELTAVQKSGDPQTIKKLYELTAEIISCNYDDIKVTAEELRDKYRVQFVHLVFIFATYKKFLAELELEKN